MRTRKGLDWTAKFAALARAARVLPDCILDGEVVVLNEHNVPSFDALQAALSEGDGEKLIFFVFDMPYLDGKDYRAEPLSVRKG